MAEIIDFENPRDLPFRDRLGLWRTCLNRVARMIGEPYEDELRQHFSLGVTYYWREQEVKFLTSEDAVTQLDAGGKLEESRVKLKELAVDTEIHGATAIKIFLAQEAMLFGPSR